VLLLLLLSLLLLLLLFTVVAAVVLFVVIVVVAFGFEAVLAVGVLCCLPVVVCSLVVVGVVSVDGCRCRYSRLLGSGCRHHRLGVGNS